MGTLSQLDGSPTALEGDVDGLARATTAIEEASQALRSLALEGVGDAMDALRDGALQTSADLDRARGRYSKTTSALRTYTVELRRAQDRAEEAIRDENASLNWVDTAEQDLWEASARVRAAQNNQVDQSVLAHYEQEEQAAYSTLELARSRVYDAHRDYAGAVAARDAAAEAAMAAIEASFDGTNDSFGDHVGNFFSFIGAAWDTFTNWAEGFFAAVLDAIRDALEAFVMFLAVALIVVLAVVAIVVLAVVLAAVIVIALIALLAIVIPIILALVVTLNVTEMLGFSDQLQVQLAILAVCIANPLLGTFILTRVASDILAPDLEVTEFNGEYRPGEDLDGKKEEALGFLEASKPASVEQLMLNASHVDAAGRDDRAVVDIACVTGPDGKPHWIVTLPSTQDWVVPGGDTGAPNDLDGNLALMLLPGFQTQYERAVIEAMEAAGIGENDPVMLVGFSQGGIMAAHLASSRGVPGEVQGVLVGGSPIDHFPIPDTIPVVSAQHQYDVVHRLDFINEVPTDGARFTVWDNQGTTNSPLVAHNSNHYATTLGDNDHNGVLSAQFADFLVPTNLPEGTSADDWSVSHQQYTFAE